MIIQNMMLRIIYTIIKKLKRNNVINFFIFSKARKGSHFNYYKLDEQTAELFIKGTWEILSNYDLYKKSFKILGLSETNDINIIKQQYRKLVKQYHPDKSGESAEQFYPINNAYQLLMRIIPLMKI
jgi:DnaJ-domain-containing protein 1